MKNQTKVHRATNVDHATTASRAISAINIKNQLPKSKLILYAFIALAILAILIYSIIIAVYRSGKVAVQLQIAPHSSTATLNNNKINHNGTIYLTPGTYHLKVTDEHFTGIERDVEISEDLPYIAAVLSASDSDGEEYRNKHNSEFIAAEGLTSQLLNKQGTLLREKYPILDYLPINNGLYSISYSFPENSTNKTIPDAQPNILVKTTDEYLDIAVAKLKTFENTTLTDYDITFQSSSSFTPITNSTPTTTLITSSASTNASASSTISAASPESLAKKIATKQFKYLSGEQINDEYYVAIFANYNQTLRIYQAHYLALFKKSNPADNSNSSNATNNTWSLVANPQPFLTTFNTPDTNSEILNTANKHAGQQ